MNVIFPEVFLTGDTSGRTKTELVADSFSMKGLIHAGRIPIDDFFNNDNPLSYGQIQVHINLKVGLDACSDEAYEKALAGEL
jgi:hypothetical protein